LIHFEGFQGTWSGEELGQKEVNSDHNSNDLKNNGCDGFCSSGGCPYTGFSATTTGHPFGSASANAINGNKNDQSTTKHKLTTIASGIGKRGAKRSGTTKRLHSFYTNIER